MWPSFVVILVRLLLPLTILRWPLWGALTAILADVADVFILQAFGWGLFQGDSYHVLDKLLDTYYLALECWTVLHWKNDVARKVAISLFILRLSGLVAFLSTGERVAFVAAPNVFENFYLLWLVFGVRKPNVWLILTIATIPKVLQEYVMHYLEFPTWEYLRDALFYWIF